MVEQPSRRRILFVDDEESIRLTLPHILAKNGFEVTSLARLDDALAEIRAQRYDVLLSDLNLPEIDGGFIGWYFIYALETVGLASNVKQPRAR